MKNSAENTISISIAFVQTAISQVPLEQSEIDRILYSCRIPRHLLQEPHARVTLAQYSKLITTLMNASNDELLGHADEPLPVGVKVLFSTSTYSLNLRVSMIAAYVEGLPIPSFSKFFINKAVKENADYVALGSFFKTKTKKIRHKANLSTLKWCKNTHNLPIVAIGGINNKNYKKLLLNQADFLAISGYIWKNKKFKPVQALKKLKK